MSQFSFNILNLRASHQHVAAKLFYPKATELACPGIAGYNDHINTERKRASPS
jgi:hypothetical protein